MNNSRWSFLIVRTRDGVRQAWVHPTDLGSWARRADNKSSGSHTFSVQEDPEVWSRMRPGRRTLVICYDGDPVYAGVIWSASYDWASQTVTISHEDIWSVWERRMAIPQWQAWESDTEVVETEQTYDGWTRRTHAKRVIQLGLRGPSGYLHSYELPIVLPEDEEENWRFTWRGFEFLTVAEGLERIAAPGGPMQVDFPLQWSTQGQLQWRLFVSHQGEFRTTHLYPEVSESPVLGLTLEHDMSEYASELQLTGSGQGADTLHRYHWLGDVQGDLVALAVQESDGTIETDDDLVSRRDELAESRRLADVQVDVSVALGEGGYSPHDFQPGQTIAMHLNDDPVIPRVDGGYRFRLLGFSPDGPNALKLELSPSDGFTGYGTESPATKYRNLRVGQFSDVRQRIAKAEKRLVY